jgi:hypothetical protein
MGSSTYYAPGRYWGHVTANALGKNKKDNPQLVIRFEVRGGIDPQDPDGALLNTGEIYERTMYRVITDKTVDWVKKDLQALGFEGQGFADITDNCFAGKDLVFECKHEDYEGSTNERWQIAHGSGALEVKPLEPAEIRKLDALFGSALKKDKPKPAGRAVRPTGNGAEKPADSDIMAETTSGAARNNDDLPF